MRNQQAHQQQIQNSDWAPEMKELFHQLFLPEDNGKQVDIKSYVGVIWRHKWLVLLTLAIIPALVAYFVLLEEPRYEATTELLIESSNQKVVQFEEVVQPDESFAYLNTKFSFLRSRTLAEKVIDSLHVTSNGVEPGAPSVPEESNELLRESQTSVETASNTPEIESGFEAEESEFDDAMGDVQDIVTGAISYVRQSIIANRHKPKFDQAELDRNDKVVGLMRRTRVEPVDGTRLVRVTISGSNPYEITDQVNTLAEIFVAQNLEYKLEASKTASAWLKREVADLKETMRNAELLLLDFIKEREYTPRDEYSQNSEDKVESDSSIESMLKNTYIKRVELESRIEELRRFLKVLPQRPQLITSDLNISSVREMQQKYIETKEQIETVSEQFKFKSQHPRIKILSERLSRLENNIKLGIQSEIERINLVKETLTKTEESFDKAISEEQENRLKFDRDSIEYNNLKRDIANKRELFESMVRRLNETEVTKGLETNNVKIAQKAIVPVNPISSKKKVKLAGSFVAALVLGTGFAIFFESLSKRFRSPEDVEDYIKIPFLGVIPHQIRKIRSQSELFGLLDAYSDFANAYRELRTNISLQSAHRSMGSIMVSSIR